MTEKLYVNVWIGNLGKYNEGELVGEWFALPCDMKEVSKVIGLNEQYEEYQINDFDTNIKGLEIHHYDNISTLNEFAEQLDQLDENEQLILQAWIEAYGTTNLFRDMDSINLDEAIVYHDVNSMEDVAYSYINEVVGSIENAISKDRVSYYIDTDAIKRDLEIDGYFSNYEEENNVELSDHEKECMIDEMIEEGSFSGEQYFNYEAFGRDMDIEGTFIFLDNNICVELLG